MTGSIPGVQGGKYEQVFDTIREHLQQKGNAAAVWLSAKHFAESVLSQLAL
jgi:hypothetical protein